MGDLFQGSVRIERECLAVVSWFVTVIGRVSLKNRAWFSFGFSLENIVGV